MLFRRKGTEVDVICFPKAAPLLSFAWMFDVLNKQVNSSIFHTTWKNNIQRALIIKPNLCITDIEEHVWKPTFKHCRDLLYMLKDMSITLSDVDKYFKKNGDELEHELNSLCRGVSMCLGKNEEFSWIHLSVVRIGQYRKLRSYCEAANLFLKLRDSLNLKNGSFTDVEKIAAKVSNTFFYCK